MQVMVTFGALVMGPNPWFVTPITFEWELCVVVCEAVFRMAEMRNFIVFHGCKFSEKSGQEEKNIDFEGCVFHL